MHRLAQIQHDVVRNIDRQRQGTHPCHLQTLDHPTRSGSLGVDTANNTSHEPVRTHAPVDGSIVSNNHGETGLVRLGNRLNKSPHKTRIAEGHTRRVRELASDASHREAVPTVWSDVNFQNFFTQAKEGNYAVANSWQLCVGEILLQDDDAVMVVAQAEFARRAHHSIRNMAVGLSGSNFKGAGKNRTRK